MGFLNPESQKKPKSKLSLSQRKIQLRRHFVNRNIHVINVEPDMAEIKSCSKV